MTYVLSNNDLIRLYKNINRNDINHASILSKLTVDEKKAITITVLESEKRLLESLLEKLL